MPAQTSPLEIQVHLVNGSVLRYLQKDDATSRKILEQLQPAKLFSERQIMIAGGYTITGYASASVARIDLIRDELPDFRFGPDITDLTEITREEFGRRYKPESDLSLKRERPWKVGEPFIGFAEMELANRTSLFLELQTTLKSKLDQRQVLQNFLAGSTLHCRRHGGGAIFLNTSAIVRWTLFPGPPEAPHNAWAAHYLASEEP